jgi:CoA-transferase family III
LYSTQNEGEYFHLHGSLDATTALNMIGLPGHDPDMADYHECLNLIESHVKKFTAAELEVMNEEKRQAGVTCLKAEEFRTTEHGRALTSEPPLRVRTLECSSPPYRFPVANSQTPRPQILSGIKVLELCRIIAGPSIGKGLAEYGASVLKITSSSLSDVPFFQLDVNVGKHCAELDLKNPEDRKSFEALLLEADVVLDGYRPGSLSRLGYGPEQTLELVKSRGKGIVYVSENCFGDVGSWSSRPGWQQIADCVTGIAWEQGRFMGLDEPVVPPFPMSDYGTGCLGTISALTGLYLRARDGGSYHGTTSLCQYDLFLLSLGTHEKKVQRKLREIHDTEFFELRHADSVDEVGRRAMASLRRVNKELFDARNRGECYSQGYGANIEFVRPVVNVEGTWNGWVRSSRPNGFDAAGWDGWEIDQDIIKACGAR